MDSDILSLLQEYSGAIRDLLDDPHVTDIMINGPDDVYCERFGSIEKTSCRFESEGRLFEFARQVAHSLGQTLDEETHPLLDARLHDGSRMNVVIPPVSVGRILVTIRPAPKLTLDREGLLQRRMLDRETLEYVGAAIASEENVLIVGGTGTGKTTVLRAFSGFIPLDERVITIEDTCENLVPSHPHVVMMEAAVRRKRAGRHSHIEVTLGRLIENALRMRPSRIIVGEIRTPAAAQACLQALNTGHRGTISTLHGNSPVEGLLRLRDLLAAEAPNIPLNVHWETVQSNMHIVIHVDRVRLNDEVRRVVTSIVRCGRGEDGKVSMRPVCRFDPGNETWAWE